MSVYYRKRGRERECVRRERAYHRAQKRAAEQSRARIRAAEQQSTQHAAQHSTAAADQSRAAE